MWIPSMKSSIFLTDSCYLLRSINLPNDSCLFAILVFGELAPAVPYFEGCVRPDVRDDDASGIQTVGHAFKICIPHMGDFKDIR
jgi:hypothetical protein